MNGLKDKDQMIIPMDAEEAFDIIQHAFMLKVLENAGPEGRYLNMIKANIILNGKSWSSPADLRKVEGMSTVPTLLNTVIKVLAEAMRQKKTSKGKQIGKELTKPSPLAEKMALHHSQKLYQKTEKL